MKTRKKFYVVAYDVSDDGRRRRVVKLLEALGTRVNFSVFECMLIPRQFTQLQTAMLQAISPKEDSVIYYPICLDCYSKIVYQPTRRKAYDKVVVV